MFKIKPFEMALSKYQLKAGVLLQAFSDASKVMTNKNITDELAEWHLKNNPACARYFSILPGRADIPDEIRKPGQSGPTIIVAPVADIPNKIKETPKITVIEAIKEDIIKRPIVKKKAVAPKSKK